MLENEEKKRVYISVMNNHFTVKVNEGEGTKRITKTGKTVWETTRKDITGRIVNVKKKITEWEGKKIISWEIKLACSEDCKVLSLNYGSNEARCFLSRLPNIDLENDVTLSVFPFAAPGKKERTYISAWQFGKKIEPYYTKENLPQLKKIMYKGEERWDDSEQEVIFEKMVLDKFPLMKKEEPEHEDVPGDSDLPF